MVLLLLVPAFHWLFIDPTEENEHRVQARRLHGGGGGMGPPITSKQRPHLFSACDACAPGNHLPAPGSRLPT